MRSHQLLGTLLAWLALLTPLASAAQDSQEAANKALAIGFYNDLWGSPNTDRYDKYVAETYVVHDIGGRKNMTEPAIEQKIIADRFWDNGTMQFELDYQVAEGDLVATRWWWHYQPDTLLGNLMFGDTSIPIVNVFRIRDGKIVEIWNHRHDIDTRMGTLPAVLAFLLGLLLAGIAGWWFTRRARRAQKPPAQ